MSREKLLNIESLELKFRFELRKQASCTVRLSNNSRKHVAFKVMTTSPEKYFVRPKNGVLLPQSSCDVTVTMQGPTEIPSNMQSKDKFLIKSVVAVPGDTAENSLKLFSEVGRVVEDCKLRVMYIPPTHQDSSSYERSRSASSNASTLQEGNLNVTPSASTLQERNLNDTPNASTLQEINLNDTPNVSTLQERNLNNTPNGSTLQERSLNHTEDKNGIHFGDLFKKGITIGLLGLIFWFLLLKILPFLWSLTFMITMLIIKMTNKLVSDSVEDW